jgi:leucyl/phenylalanyl-tRNA--protein transferase
MNKLCWLGETSDPDWFPPDALALTEPPGLLAAGGDLSPRRLLAAYRRGIFPWYSAPQPILWWSPDPRMVLLPEEFRISRSLAKTLRNGPYKTEYDRNFSATIRACAAPRRAQAGTWLSPAMIEAYEALHSLGYAHSVETYRDEQLVGGLYGVRLGGVFFGESMWSGEPNVSKIALVRLVELCRAQGIHLIDCQVASQHLDSLGAREIPRGEFQALLARWAHRNCAGSWRRPEP